MPPHKIILLTLSINTYTGLRRPPVLPLGPESQGAAPGEYLASLVGRTDN